MGIVGGMRFHWPRSLQQVFVMFNIALFDIDVYVPTCGFPAWGGNHAFYLMLCLPLMRAPAREREWPASFEPHRPTGRQG